MKSTLAYESLELLQSPLFTAININSLGPIPAGKSSNITETIFRNLFRPCWLQPNQPF